MVAGAGFSVLLGGLMADHHNEVGSGGHAERKALGYIGAGCAPQVGQVIRTAIKWVETVQVSGSVDGREIGAGGLEGDGDARRLARVSEGIGVVLVPPVVCYERAGLRGSAGAGGVIGEDNPPPVVIVKVY